MHGSSVGMHARAQSGWSAGVARGPTRSPAFLVGLGDWRGLWRAMRQGWQLGVPKDGREVRRVAATEAVGNDLGRGVHRRAPAARR